MSALSVDGLSCVFDNDCRSVDCCLTMPVISRNVAVRVDIDFCHYKLFFAIESFNQSLLLDISEFGEWKMFQLQGVVQIR
mgnify:FL=1